MDKRNLTDGGNACSPSIAGIEAARPLSLMMGPFQDPICVRSRHGPTLPASETAGDVTRRGRREEIGGDDELAPFRVESGCWLRGNRVLERPPLLLELRNVVAYRREHVAIFRQLCLVAHRLAMAGDDDRLVRYSDNIPLGRLDHPVDVPAGRVVDEGIDAIPVRIPTSNNIRFREGDGDVAIRMSGPIVLQGKLGTVQVDRHI